MRTTKTVTNNATASSIVAAVTSADARNRRRVRSITLSSTAAAKVTFRTPASDANPFLGPYSVGAGDTVTIDVNAGAVTQMAGVAPPYAIEWWSYNALVADVVVVGTVTIEVHYEDCP